MSVLPSVLVTGAGGFLGQELCRQLGPAFRVIGADLSQVPHVRGVEWIQIGATSTLARAVLDRKPSVVIHAAFRNRKPPDWTDEEYIAEAVSAGVSLFDAAAATGTKVLLVSSSAVYGTGGGTEVIDETTPRQPVSVYGRAKAAVEDAALEAAVAGMEVCIARLFNLIGPRPQAGMMVSDWVKQAVSVKDGDTNAIQVHHRRTSRDLVDVRDAARALALLAGTFHPGEVFNVASGEAISLMEISIELEALARRPLEFVETVREVDPTDVLSQRGSSAKLSAALGWQPKIAWRSSLADLWQTVDSASRV